MLRGHSGGGSGVSCMKHDQNGEMMAASVSLSGFGPAASSVYTESSQKRPGVMPCKVLFHFVWSSRLVVTLLTLVWFFV